MVSAALSELPEDILFEIVDHFVTATDDATPEPLACLHTSNALRSIAHGHLFRHVTIVYAVISHGALEVDQLVFFIDHPEEEKASGQKFLDLLRASPQVASRIHNLTILPVLPGSPLKEKLQENTDDFCESSLQHILPMLTSLDHLSFPSQYNHISWRGLHKDSRKSLKKAMRRLPTNVSGLDIRGMDYFPVSLIVMHPNVKRISFETLADSLGLPIMKLPFSATPRPLQLSHLQVDLQGIPR